MNGKISLSEARQGPKLSNGMAGLPSSYFTCQNKANLARYHYYLVFPATIQVHISHHYFISLLGRETELRRWEMFL